MPSFRTKAEGRHSNAPLLSDEKRDELIAALDGTRTCRELAEQFGVSVDYLHCAISKWRLRGLPVKAKRQKMPVVVRGVMYPDVESAAAALNVKPMTIYSALTRGTTESVGTGTRRSNNGKVPRPVRFAGKEYPSAKDLAAKAGLPMSTIRRGLRGSERAAQYILGAMMAADARRMMQAAE